MNQIFVLTFPTTFYRSNNDITVIIYMRTIIFMYYIKGRDSPISVIGSHEYTSLTYFTPENTACVSFTFNWISCVPEKDLGRRINYVRQI